jgi:hypothetical protein
MTDDLHDLLITLRQSVDALKTALRHARACSDRYDGSQFQMLAEQHFRLYAREVARLLDFPPPQPQIFTAGLFWQDRPAEDL